jgi:hypothetical protein
MSTECKISVLSINLHKHDAFHEDWVWLDAEKGVNFSFYASEENELVTHGVSSTDEGCDDYVGGSSSGEKEEGDECDLESVMSSPKSHSAYKTVKSFLHARSNGKHDKQNILNLWFMLFHLKCNILACTFICMQVLMCLLFIIFVGLTVKQ